MVCPPIPGGRSPRHSAHVLRSFSLPEKISAVIPICPAIRHPPCNQPAGLAKKSRCHITQAYTGRTHAQPLDADPNPGNCVPNQAKL